MHTKHHQLNLKHENETLRRQTFFLLIHRAAWWNPHIWVKQWQRLMEIIRGCSTPINVDQILVIMKLRQALRCRRASWLLTQNFLNSLNAFHAMSGQCSPRHSDSGHPICFLLLIPMTCAPFEDAERNLLLETCHRHGHALTQNSAVL